MKTVCLTHLKKTRDQIDFTTTADDAEAAAKKRKN